MINRDETSATEYPSAQRVSLFVFLKVFLYYIIIATIISSNNKAVVVCHQCTRVSKVQSQHEGHFNIIGFFPVNAEHPEEMDVNYMMCSEVMRYVIAQFNENHTASPQTSSTTTTASPQTTTTTTITTKATTTSTTKTATTTTPKTAKPQSSITATATQHRKLISYTIYDTCTPDEFDVTTAAVLDFMVDDPYHNNRNSLSSSNTCSCSTNNPLQHTLGIVGPAISSKCSHVNKLLSYYRLPMISYASTSPQLSDAAEYPALFRTILPDVNQARVLEDFLVEMDWTYISILHSDDTYGRNGALALLRSGRLCAFLDISVKFPLHKPALSKVMLKLKNNRDSNVVVLWGHFQHVQSIIREALVHRVHNKTWLVSEASGRNPWFLDVVEKLSGSVIVVVPNGGRDLDFEKYFLDLTAKDGDQNPWVKTFLRSRGVNSSQGLRDFRHLFDFDMVGHTRNAVVTLLDSFTRFVRDHSMCDIDTNTSCVFPPITNHTEFSDVYIQNSNFSGMLNERVSFGSTGDILNGAFDLYMITSNTSKKSSTQFHLIASWNSKTHLNTHRKSIFTAESRCSDVCAAGFTPAFSNSIKNCCWKCVKCKEGQYKTNKSLESCLDCPKHHASSHDRLTCIPYSRSDLSRSATLIVTISSCIGAVVTIFVVILFVVARKTQHVRNSNIQASLTQLSLHLLLFLVTYLFVGRDDETKCTMRSFAAGTLLSLIIGITLAKITHILTLFTTTHHLTDKQLAQLRTTEATIVMTSLLLQVAIMLALLELQPIVMVVEVVEGETVYHCHSTLHYKGQLIYIILLQGVCCVQAFRARKLPSGFNESTHIALGMLVSIVVLSLSLPLHMSYNRPREKKFIVCLIILVANFSIFLVTYTHRVGLICGRAIRNRGLSQECPTTGQTNPSFSPDNP